MNKSIFSREFSKDFSTIILNFPNVRQGLEARDTLARYEVPGVGPLYELSAVRYVIKYYYHVLSALYLCDVLKPALRTGLAYHGLPALTLNLNR